MLSIDITDRQVKLVRGVHSGNKIKIQDADMRELALGMVSNGYITDVPMVAAELNNIIKSKDIKEKDCIVSITSSAIVYKELTIAKPKKKNPAIIEAMIQSTMNISADFNISFTIAGETEDEEKNKMLKVMAAACPQRLVDGYVRLFSQIGLSLKAVNISNNSITRLITNTPKMSDRMPLLLIQIDKNFINMNLYEDNQLAFSRFSTIDPSQFETDEQSPDDSSYVSQAVYDNLFGMMNFIRGRKNAKPLQEIAFYGEIDSFIEITNAISSFNVPTNMLTMPSSIIAAPSAQFDFSKFANAIGALYSRNKELEHINLLEATSAKESKGSGMFGLACLGAAVLAAGVVGGACVVTSIINSSLNSQIEDYTAKIQDPQMQKDLQTVADREAMLAGFNNYNDTITRTQLLFNYDPKAQSLVYNKLKSPIEEEDFLGEDETLAITQFSCSGYTVNATFRGSSKGDPSSVPSRYAEYLINQVKNKYGDPYFVNVSYNGFKKDNASDEGAYAIMGSEDTDDFTTVFTFQMSMNLQMGSDEDHTDAENDFKNISSSQGQENNSEVAE
ncbi:MAG: pilus assembly protein PilM [Oscillospiraceae bacterium]|nr:pilus assembly protein PilM [Oscillospiraceae bacterium]